MKSINPLQKIWIIAAVMTVVSACTQAGDNKQTVDLVNPLLDAANSRWFYFSSACRPFGMVNLSPDMKIDGTWESGYRYNRDTIRFFSHIHAWQLSGIPVLPVTGEFRGHLGPAKNGSHYSHENEIVKPGYHSIILDRFGVKAELTSTTRVGFHRYEFPASEEKYVLLDLGTMLAISKTEKGYAKKVSHKEIEGYALMAGTRRRPKPVYVFYVMQFDTPFEEMQAWKDKKIIGTKDEIEGSDIGVFMNFTEPGGQTVRMKVGISYVSAEQARLNIDSELPHWDFNRVVRESAEDWNDWLSRIEVEGNSEKARSRFYTDLWHALQGRRIISDVNGKYCDMTGPERRIAQIPLDENNHPVFNHYNSDSFWGAQWTLNTLWHLVYPEISEEFVNSMLLMYDDGGLIPRGPSGGNYTYVMTGASSTPFIVSAYMKGIRGFDAEKAYEGMRKNAFPGGMMSKAGYEHNTAIGGGIEYYIERGYIPWPLADRRYGYHQDGAGQTLEYAYQDWCLAQMARSLGKEEDYRMFMKRAGNYKNIWDEETGWMRPRTRDGKWYEPFDHLTYDLGFVEATPAQFTWFVPHDLKGLGKLMGGNEEMALKLNRSFLIAEPHNFTTVNYRADRFVTRERRRAYINYGNQPSMQTAFIFNYAGQPWLTQHWNREVIEKVYSHNDPQHGYNGDEDQGLMGALSVLMKMGIFEMRGGAAIRPVYEIGSPIFDRIIIHLNRDYYSGEEFVIEAQNNSPENQYIHSATLDGKTLEKCWFYHEEMVDGGKLILVMADKPNKEWGSKPDMLPPSMSDE